MRAHWTTLLDDFQQAVKEKKYSKVPYDLWRNMKQRYCWVTYTRDMVKQGVQIIFEDRGTSEREATFLTLDSPFGQFLWDRLDKFHDDALDSAINKMKDSFSTLAATAKNATANLTNTIKNEYAYGNWDTTSTFQITPNNFLIDNKTIDEIIDEAVGNSFGNRKENNNMTNLFKGFDFGSCENDNVKMSMYGVAVKNANGTWVSYDPKSGSVIDVDILNFNAKYLYKMPAAIKDIKVSDVIIHNRKPMFVTGIEEGKLLVIDPAAGEEKIVLPTKSMFGFDFVTRVVNLFNDAFGGASADAPFGNMLPVLMLADGGKTDDMLPLMFAMNGGKMDMSNPMMMYFLMRDNKNSDMLPLMFLANNNGFSFGKTCTCDCDKAN